MIKILWSEIKLDVDKQTWRLAKVRISDNELKNDAQEDNSVTSQKFVLRFAESGVAMVQTALRERLQSSTVSYATDALNAEKESWTFTFTDLDNASEEALAMLIHKFIVAYILYRWCLEWLSDNISLAKAFQTEYINALSDITSTVYSLGTPVKRRPPEPFVEEIEVEYE